MNIASITISQKVIDEYQLSQIELMETTISKNTLYSASSDIFKQEIVIKCYANQIECLREAAFLKLYHKTCFVELLAACPEENINIFEKIDPGSPLHFPKNKLSAIKNVCTIIDIMRQKFIQNQKFPKIEEYLSALKINDKTPHQLPIQKCKMIFEDLLSTLDAKEQYLLHGDLHHENILKSKNHSLNFAVIDPKGVMGECGFELACFILNPLQLAMHSHAKNIIQMRINEFSKQLNLDPIRLTQWCLVKAVLSACFALEDNWDNQYKHFLILSNIVESIL